MERLNNFLHKRKYLFGFLTLLAAGVLIVVFYLNNTVKELSEANSALAKWAGVLIILCATLTILSYVFTVWLKTSALKAYVIFSFIAACLLGLIIPPNCVPDEFTHFKTAYYYSNILMGRSELNTEKSLGMRLCDITDTEPAVNIEKYENIFGNFSVLNHESAIGYKSAKKRFVSSSPFYAYLPQTLGVTLSRLLNFSGVMTFYLARTFNLLLYFALLILSLKRMPFAKNALAVIGTVPIALQQVMSLSSDAVILGLSVFCFSMSMHFLYGKKQITFRDVVTMCVAGILLAPCKLVYFSIPLLSVFAGRTRYENKKLKNTARIAIPLLVFASLFVFQFANIASHADTESLNSNFDDPIYTVGYIFTDTGKFVEMLVRTVIANTPFYMRTALCSGFGWFQLETSDTAVALLAVIIVLSVFTVNKKDNPNLQISPVQRLVSAAVFSAVCLTVLLSMFLSWTPNTYNYISGVQGRYLLPALPFIIPILKTKKITASNEAGNLLLFSSNALTYFIIIYIFVAAVS